MPTKRYPSNILATCPIPWTEAYAFAEPIFCQEVHWLRTHLTPTLYIFGTAGEGYAVTDDQFRRIAEAFTKAMQPEGRPMVGVISLSLATVIQRIEYSRTLGIREFQLSLPSWGTLTDTEVDRFFAETCGRFPDCLFFHYNLARAGRILDGKCYARIAKAHPNLVGVKMGGENVDALVDVLTAAPTLQFFFTEFGFAAVRDRFEVGLLATLSSVYPPLANAYFNARGARLADLCSWIRHLHHDISEQVRREAHIDGAFDKIYSRIRVPEFPLRLLPPYCSVSETTFRHIKDRLPPVWRMEDA